MVGFSWGSSGHPHCQEVFQDWLDQWDRLAQPYLAPDGNLEEARRIASTVFRSKRDPAFLDGIYGAMATGARVDARLAGRAETLSQEHESPLQEVLARRRYQYSAYLDGDGVLGDPSSQRTQLQTFPAFFRSFPISFFNKGAPRMGIPDDAQLFGMFLGDAEIRQHFPEGYEFPFRHLHQAFAYIRYYLRGTDLFITEIQSEVFGKLKNPDQKKRYRQWAKFLLMAFEEFAQTPGVFVTAPQRIVIAGKDYQARRWVGGEFSENLFRMLYQQLPGQTGYQAVSNLKNAFEWAEQVEETALIPISDGWQRVLDPNKRSLLEVQFAAALKRQAMSSLAVEKAHWEYYRDGFLESISPPLNEDAKVGLDLSPLIKVRAREVSPLENTAMSQGLLALYAYARAEVPREFDSLLNGSFTWIGPGEQKQANGLFYHNDSLGRHPMIRLPGPSYWLGVKGGGLANLRVNSGGSGVYTVVTPNVESERLPVYLLQEGEKATRVTSHRYWGGMEFNEGQRTFENMVGLRAYLAANDPGLAGVVPIPVRLMDIAELPVWRNGQLTLLPIKDYQDQYLQGRRPRLVTLQAIHRSPFRLDQTVKDLLFPDGPRTLDSIKELLQERFSLLYEAFGYSMVVPEGWNNTEAPQPLVDEAITRASLKLIRELAAANPHASQSIATLIEERLLKTLAWVHGSGGHLGGTSLSLVDSGVEGGDFSVTFLDPPVGAPGGGSMDIRNLSLAGEINDLDANIHLPWLTPSFEYTEAEKTFLLKSLQKEDLVLWQNAVYWYRHLLLGRELRPRQALVLYPFGKPGETVRVVPIQFDQGEERERWVLTLNHLPAALTLPMTEIARFVEPHHGEIYRQAFESSATKVKDK